MGLDTVELLMDIEKAFNIAIPDQEAETIITVGDFHRIVWSHVDKKHNDKCSSQVLFYKLRRSAMERFDIPKQAFQLSAPVNTLFPQQNRRQVYFDFGSSNELEFPPLTLSRSWFRFLTIIGYVAIAGSLALAIILINFFSYNKWLMLLPIAGILLTIGVSVLLKPFHTVIDYYTVKDFLQKVLAINYGRQIKESGTNQLEVEMLVNHIIADRAGLPLADITPEKRICDDLGLD